MIRNAPIRAHGGDVEAVAKALGVAGIPEVHMDFSVNVNPIGPPPCVTNVMLHGMDVVSEYPQPAARRATAALAVAHGVPEECVIAGNGSTEILAWLVQSLKPRNAGWIIPCYGGYHEICSVAGIKGHSVHTADSRNGFKVPLDALRNCGADMLFLASPNNPTGMTLAPAALLKLAARAPSRWIVVDESFIDFLPDPRRQTLIRRGIPRNLIVVKSLTKFFAIPGLRLGMAYAHPHTIRRIAQSRLPWTVNGLAQSVAEALYSDSDYIETTRTTVAKLRARFSRDLSLLPGFTVYRSEANFVLVSLPPEWPAPRLQKYLLQRGILIRSCHDFPGLGDKYCRLAVRPANEIAIFIKTVRSLIAGEGWITTGRAEHRTPAIMVAGTASNAGKSVVTTALCRFFARNNFDVAPFKAQNMSLNSHVTREGGEIGRAQVVQARAAGIEPHTDMNPVLLKPMGEYGCQVVLNGHAIGNLSARSYYRMRARIRKAAVEAYDRLASRHALLVLEGAGSAAEINLLRHDIVNMPMAEYAAASVILVADIDRGGVFASIYGTISLLPARYRRLISGVIINKFRGDVSLLRPGIRQIERITGIKVLGVLPYIRDLGIEDEDSVSLDERRGGAAGLLDMVVVRLPRICNFTDFLPLEKTPGVVVRYTHEVRELGKPDLIVIPGTKNTRADLRFVRESGWETALIEARRRHIPIFGICGGYQMLGASVADPSGVEGARGVEEGLGFLPVVTTLEKQKELSQVSGKTTGACPFARAGALFEGYEIHAGRTVHVRRGRKHAAAPGNSPLLVTRRMSEKCADPEGVVSNDGLVFGCYIHGLFDNNNLRRQMIAWLCKRKGIAPPETAGRRNTAVDEIDRIADVLEEHIDMKRILELAAGPNMEKRKHK